jgi:hypothetical protein
MELQKGQDLMSEIPNLVHRLNLYINETGLSASEKVRYYRS